MHTWFEGKIGFLLVLKCVMFKGNESYARNINSESQTKRGEKFLCFTMFLNIKELFISLQPDVRLRWGLNQDVAF